MDIKDTRKELYRLLKIMYKLSEENKYSEYLKIKNVYDHLVRQIEDKKENFKWDSARNKIVNIFFFKNSRSKTISEEDRDKWINRSKREFLESMEELKVY